MIVSRTPFRISFFGGGTDYPAWYREHGGAVLATAIDKYCYLTARRLPPFFEHRHRIVYSKIEMVRRASEITHPAVRAVLDFLKIEGGVEIHHDGDLPARSGMGSSSSFTVGLLHAVHALQGRVVSKAQLAMEGIRVEQEILKETVGSQDQVIAAHGGLNHVTFHRNGEITVCPVTLSAERIAALNNHLMLFYTGIRRTASDVARSYVADMDSRKRQLLAMREMVDGAIALLNGRRDMDGFGKLLHEAWLVKRSLSSAVTNPEVDAIYAVARRAGALGGKLTGAGGGGFMLLFVPPERRAKVRKALGKLLHIPFRFDFHGSQIIFYDPGEDYTEAEKDRENRMIHAFRELSAE
ncbi:MAG: kinase [Verrucomicrobiae bacterium]|nr:kinase [Verrucomicrobiae bacterium]